MSENKIVSLSWLIVSTRDYKPESDWIWDKKHGCCYGISKEERTGNLQADLAKQYRRVNSTEEYYEQCVLMPELQDHDIESAAAYLRDWCEKNQISYKEDLEQYKKVEAFYWGYDDVVEELGGFNDSSGFYNFSVG